MSQESKHKRPSFSDEFQRDAVNLIVNQGYFFRAAAEAVGVMCRVRQASTSGCYRSLKAEPGPRAQRSARIRDAVAAAFEASNEVYGSAKIARTLETDPELATACRNAVAMAMREMGLKSRVSKKVRPSTS